MPTVALPRHDHGKPSAVPQPGHLLLAPALPCVPLSPVPPCCRGRKGVGLDQPFADSALASARSSNQEGNPRATKRFGKSPALPGALRRGRKRQAVPCRSLERPHGQHVSSPMAAAALPSAPGSTRDGARSPKTAACTCLSPRRPVQSMAARTEQISESWGSDPAATPRHREHRCSPGWGSGSPKHRARAGESGAPPGPATPGSASWGQGGAQPPGQPQEQGRGCRILHFIPATTDASSVPVSPPAPRAELRAGEPGAARDEPTRCPAVTHQGRPGRALGTHSFPDWQMGPEPPPHALRGLLCLSSCPQHGWQRAPSPSSTRHGTGTQALPGLPPPSPLLPLAQRSPGVQLEPALRTHLSCQRASPRCRAPRCPAAMPSPPRVPGWGQAFAVPGMSRAVGNQSQPPITSLPVEPGRSGSIWFPLGTRVPAQDHGAALQVPPPPRYLRASPSSFQDNAVPIKLIRRSCNP